MKKALLLVDLQNDFFPQGALAVKEGDKVLPVINKLLEKKWNLIIASRDWHPHNHGSFANTHRKKPGERVVLRGLEQILWPVHCVQNTKGAEFAPGWDTKKVSKVFEKGTESDIDSYSIFFDNGHLKKTGLEEFLKKSGVEEIYIAGLTTEYCVAYSALDAISLGFKTHVVLDGCRGVNLKEGDEERAIQRMKEMGVHLVTSDKL